MSSTAQDRAYASIKERIINFDLKPGQELRADALAKQIGVSRTPIREALSRLQQEGLVTRQSGWGYAVRALSPPEIGDLFKLREVLEVMAIEEAIPHINDKQLKAMENALAKCERLLALKKLSEFRKELRDFHMTIANATHNYFLEQILRMINDRVRQVATLQFDRHAERPTEVIKENQRILAALRKRDATAARAAILVHLRNAKRIFAILE